jgi:hypothetical protein
VDVLIVNQFNMYGSKLPKNGIYGLALFVRKGLRLMRITFKNKEKVLIGTERTRAKFLLFPKTLKLNKDSKDLQFRWLCRASWVETMDEWYVELRETSRVNGYSPGDGRPNAYGWKPKYWIDKSF